MATKNSNVTPPPATICPMAIIGPTRQMQAGHDRPVFVHNIIARDTVDEMVIERVNSKREVHDILLEAMKRHETN